MGWIFNGSEFIKANKAQRDAFNKHKQHELIKEGLAEPYALPTLAIVGASLAGVVTLGGLGALLFGPGKDWLEEKEDWAEERVEQIVDKIKGLGISSGEQTKLVSDGRACMAASISPVPVVTSLNFFNCMRKKGWSDKIIIEYLNPFA